MNRKRPAPGTSPMVQQPNAPQQSFQYQPQPFDTNQLTNFDLSNAFQNDQSLADPNNFDPNAFSYDLNNQQAQGYGGNHLPPTPSTELVRRSRNQQVLPQSQAQAQDAWGGGNGYAGNMNGTVEDEDEQDLDTKVALAKKDAQGKRKQIPPFVQKLSSFLDSGNTSLIRWSDDGRSFIVLDEDEFARTLIPELFKHNNYASFVRQLNMYGFHKTVNITDGSLRQSEKARKGVKPPSMYSHPYFRKNRPDLLWLIQKPSGKAGGKRKRDGTLKEDSDEERGFSPAPEGRPHELSAPSGSHDVAQLPRNEMNAVRQELNKLQTQQKFISQMITQLKQQNDEFYRQASAFQNLHDRHENSINAILTFLASIYNRSVDGNTGQTLVNMFANAARGAGEQQHGSVVEEYNETTPTPSNQVQRYQKRPQMLLPSSTSNLHDQQGTVSTAPNSARASASPPGEKRESVSSVPSDAAHQQGVSPPIKTDAQTPDLLTAVPDTGNQTSNQDQMMDLINSANATAAENASGTEAPQFNISDMVDQLGNRVPGAQQPFTAQQRDSLLSTLGQQTGSNNALTSRGSNPNFDPTALHQSQEQLNSLQSLQREQEAQIQNLQSKLTPMSPTGSIPGLAGGYDSQNLDPFDSIGAPGDYDPNSFINFDDGADFDFGFDTSNDVGGAWGTSDAGVGGDGTGQDMFASGDGDVGPEVPLQEPVEAGGGRVESVSSSATSPAAGGEEQETTPRKRAKRSG